MVGPIFLKGTFLTNDVCVIALFCSKAFFIVSAEVEGCCAFKKSVQNIKANERNFE